VRGFDELSISRPNPKGDIAHKRTVGSGHHHFAGGRSIGDGRSHQSVRYHCETRARAVEGNGSCALKALAKNLYNLPGFAQAGHYFNERAKPHGQAEDCAIAARPAAGSRAIKETTCSFYQSRIGILSIGTSEAMQRGQRPVLREPKDRSEAARRQADCSPIKIPVGALNQRCSRIGTVWAIDLNAEAVKRCQCSRRTDFEYCSVATGSPLPVVP
jgi:hypothetical protein